MPKKPPIARISITIPADVLKLADELASRLDRSRSWVIAEAVRCWRPAPHGGSVPAPEWKTPHRSNRHDQLHSDMALSIEARVDAAEDGNRLDRELRPPCRGVRLTLFDRYEDYIDWKKYEGIIR
jgi:hypothetical protein